VENVLVEGNLVEHSPIGLQISGGVGLLTRANRFVDCRRELYDPAAEVQRWRVAVAQVAAQPRPLAYWSFDQLAGPKMLKGASPLDLDLTTVLHGSATLAPGLRGQALQLDGRSYAEVASDSACLALNLSNFTLAAWIKPQVVQGRWGLISKRVGHAQSPFVLGFTNGGLTFEATDTDGKWSYNFTSPPVLKAGEWQHVAAVVEEGRAVTLYVNGRLVAHRDLQGQKLASNDQALRFGWEAWGGDPPNANTPGFFTGLLDEVKIWARPLSAQEIAAEASR
jgi:hypothetical protein